MTDAFRDFVRECELTAISPTALNVGFDRCRRERGFTLLEALVVLTIIALAVAIFAPNLRTIGGFSERQLSAGLTSDLQSLRDDAVRTGAVTALRLEDGGYVLEPSMRRRTIPKDATLRMRIGNPLQLGDDDERLIFYPDGSANGARLEVSQAGRRDAIDIRPLDSSIADAIEK